MQTKRTRSATTLVLLLGLTASAPAATLIEGATILTAGPAGTIQGSILVDGGKITAVGPDLQAPQGATRVDARI